MLQVKQEAKQQKKHIYTIQNYLQGRSFNVMNYILGLEEISKNEEFLKWSYKNLTAHGMSSSDVVIVDNKEDRQASRRVEFRIRTKAEDKLIEFVKEFDGT